MRAALLCATYQLNPLMKHVFLVGYKNKVTQKTDWSIQIGIGATRLAASRRGPVSYIDGPRIMTEDEQKQIRGKVETDKIWAVVKLGGKKGATSVGYGSYPRTGPDPKGCEKGNSRENMAMIRSERQALDRLYPAEMPMPSDVELVDEAYEPAPKVEVIEGTVADISEAVELPLGASNLAENKPVPPPAEDVPSEPDVNPFPKLTAKYSKLPTPVNMLTTCWIHDKAWTKNKYDKLYHVLTGGGFCNFNDRLNKPEHQDDKDSISITAEIGLAAGFEDGIALNEKTKKEYDGRTWSKLSESEQLTVLESLLK